MRQQPLLSVNAEERSPITMRHDRSPLMDDEARNLALLVGYDQPIFNINLISESSENDESIPPGEEAAEVNSPVLENI